MPCACVCLYRFIYRALPFQCARHFHHAMCMFVPIELSLHFQHTQHFSHTMCMFLPCIEVQNSLYIFSTPNTSITPCACLCLQNSILFFQHTQHFNHTMCLFVSVKLSLVSTHLTPQSHHHAPVCVYKALFLFNTLDTSITPCACLYRAISLPFQCAGHPRACLRLQLSSFSSWLC